MRLLRRTHHGRASKGEKMIRNRIAPGVILGVLALSAPAMAQTALGTLRGAVLDQQGGALPGVTVTVRQVETGTVQTAQSGSEGQFFLPNLRPGKYELSSELSGFAPRTE